MYTVTVDESLSWLTDPGDPTGPQVTAGTRRPSDPTTMQDGDFRQFPQNQTQLISRDTITRQFPITLDNLTAQQLSQIELWVGRTLCLRTFDGFRYFGGYLQYQPHWYPRTQTYSVALAFQLVSFSEVSGT